MRVCAPHGKLRRPMSDASDGVQNACEPISATQAENPPQTRTSIEFSSLAIFRAAGVQTCKPGTHPGSHLLRYRYPAQARADAEFNPSTRAVRCEPQTLQTLFSGQTVAQCCACAPVLEYRWEGPLSPGTCMRAPTITIGGDHHHRHNHHRHWPGVTVVMVVTVAPYCLHRRKHRYALGTIITQGA